MVPGKGRRFRFPLSVLSAGDEEEADMDKGAVADAETDADLVALVVRETAIAWLAAEWVYLCAPKHSRSRNT